MPPNPHPVSDGVHCVSPSERAEALACITGAFSADPLPRFAWPNLSLYLAVFGRVTIAYAGRSFDHAAAYACTDVRGVALWLPPGVTPDLDATAKVLDETVPRDRTADLTETLAAMDRWRPTCAHWHLPMIGVDPLYQGRGLGGSLLRSVLARCDRDGLPAYLESSNPRNRRLYERCGFRRLGVIQIGAAPPVEPMLREPRTEG